MATATIDTTELRLLARQIERSGRGLSTTATHAIGARVLMGVKDRLEKGIGPDGKAHKPLSSEWREFKRKARRSEAIWQYTGESKRKVRVRYVGEKIIIYIDTPYSGHADEVRPVMGVSEDEYRDISRIALDDLSKQAFG